MADYNCMLNNVYCRNAAEQFNKAKHELPLSTADVLYSSSGSQRRQFILNSIIITFSAFTASL